MSREIVYQALASFRLDAVVSRLELGNSSGLMVTEWSDGTLEIGYVDYEVGFFGDRDFECFYVFDKENAARFKACLLQKGYEGDLFDQCAAAFTYKCSSPALEEFCQSNAISYERRTY